MSTTNTIADRTRRKRRAADTLTQPSADKGDQSGVHDSVVGVIGRWILGGVYASGDLLPREDDLAEKLGVSRTSIREAVKVLSAKGLLHARRRVGVRVCERDEWNLLDSLVLSWHPDIGRDEALKTSLIEARSIIEPAAAALAAKRATAVDLVRIEQAYLGMERNVRTDLEACCEADLRFHASVIAASHNVVLKGLTGTIEAALHATFAITNRLMTAQSRALAAHRAVFECIRMRDADGARDATIALLGVAARDLESESIDAGERQAPRSKPQNIKVAT